MYENTGRAGARDGGRADRRRRRRPRHLPPPLRGHARTPSSSCWRAALANVERFDGGALTLHAPDPRRLPPRGRRGELLGGHHRPPALGRGHRRSPRWCASCSPDGRAAAQGLAARHRRPRRRLAHRPRRRRGRAPPGRGLLHRAGSEPDARRSFLRRAGRRAASQVTLAGRARPRRQARGDDSHDVVARPCGGARQCARSATPARSTRSRPGCCSCSSAARRRVQRFLMALPKRYETVARLGCDLDHRRPGGRDHADRARPAGATLRAAHRADPPAPAGLLGRQGRRPRGPTSCARAGEAVELPEREVHGLRASSSCGATDDRAAFAHRVLGRAPTCAR